MRSVPRQTEGTRLSRQLNVSGIVYFRQRTTGSASLREREQTATTARIVIHYFNNCRNMEKMDAVAGLAALAQENRLDVYRLLVQAGPDGMAAGEVATALGIAPNTLSFHFDRLRHAGLVGVARQGRSLIYAARYETMTSLLAYLTENCCAGKTELCAPAVCSPPKPTRKRTKETVR
jgi:DNA-binding transcriptional ArsR family regulator